MKYYLIFCLLLINQSCLNANPAVKVGGIIGAVSGVITKYSSYQPHINANECEMIFGSSSHASSYTCIFKPSLHFNYIQTNLKSIESAIVS